MAYNYVTVQATYETASGTAATGRYQWYPTASIDDSVNHINFELDPVLGVLDITGAMSVQLLATDNAGLSTFYWTFTLFVEGEEVIPKTFEVRFADGATQHVDGLTEAPG